MSLGFEGLVGLDALAIGHDRGAAVAMGDRHHPLHFMQVVGNFQVVPVGLLPVGEDRGDDADRPAGDVELAVQVLPAAARHIGPGVGGEARIDAFDQHRLVARVECPGRRGQGRGGCRGREAEAERAAAREEVEAAAAGMVKRVSHRKVAFPC
jgi:hypothetical protein